MKNLKSNLILLTIATIVAIQFNACKKDCTNEKCRDNLTTKEVPITGKIKGVIIEGPWDVTITQDSSNNSAVLEYCSRGEISAKLLSNGYLQIKISSLGNLYHNHGFRATIKAAALEKIEADGATKIRTYGHFCSLNDISLSGASSINGLSSEGFDLNIELCGASDLKSFTFSGNSMNTKLSDASEMHFSSIDLDYCTVNLSGASVFSGGGYADKSVFTGSDASDFKTLNLVSETLDINLSGVSVAAVTVNNNIKGRLTDASTLKYKGDANVSGVSLSGESRIIKLD